MRAPITRPAMRALARAAVRLLTHTDIRGAEKIPPRGPLLVVFNHLGHIDALVLMSVLPFDVEAIALADLLSVPVTGFMMRLYGVIPVHRDEVDRNVVKRALAVLAEGRVLALAPEARMSVTGALERARGGAAYLALKARVPVLPVGLTGTENAHVYGAWTRLRRPHLTATVGDAFTLPDLPLSAGERKQSLDRASTMIMIRLARLLPPAYRGVYAGVAAGASSTETADTNGRTSA